MQRDLCSTVSRWFTGKERPARDLCREQDYSYHLQIHRRLPCLQQKKAVVEEPQVELKHGNRSRRCLTEAVSNGRHRWPCCENRQGPPRGTHPHDIIYFFNRVPLQFLTVLPGTESLHYDVPQGRKWPKNLHSCVWEDKSHCTNLQSWQLRMGKELQVCPSQHTRAWIRDSPDISRLLLH